MLPATPVMPVAARMAVSMVFGSLMTIDSLVVTIDN